MTSLEFELPAVQGIQAGRSYYLTACPLRLLSRLFPENDDASPARRQPHPALNRARIPEIARYITGHPRSYVFGALAGQVSPAELRKQFVHAHGIALAAVGRVGQSLLAVNPKNWQAKLGGLRALDWSRSNARLWEGRAMIAGRLSKASSCVVLTANAIKQQLGLPLTTDEAALERQFKKRGRA